MGKDDDRKPPKEQAGESEMEGLRETSKHRPLNEGTGRRISSAYNKEDMRAFKKDSKKQLHIKPKDKKEK